MSRNNINILGTFNWSELWKLSIIMIIVHCVDIDNQNPNGTVGLETDGHFSNVDTFFKWKWFYHHWNGFTNVILAAS